MKKGLRKATLPMTAVPGAFGHRHGADVQSLTKPLQRGLSLCWGVRQGQTDAIAASVRRHRRPSAARGRVGSTRCPMLQTGAPVK